MRTKLPFLKRLGPSLCKRWAHLTSLILRRGSNRLSQGSDLPKSLLKTIQRGTLAYTYKGVPTLKNPFDWALYPMLFWEVRPRTIIEIGSNKGGSALWMADLMCAFALPCQIHSVDIVPVTGVEAPGVTFHAGDAHDLARVLDSEFMDRIARPLLVIEDSDHRPSTTLAVLRFFDQWLRPGEFILIEDGILTDMGQEKAFAGGPHRAIEAFLAERGGDYVVDTRYCDWFGRNVTWNVNGFLRRVK